MRDSRPSSLAWRPLTSSSMMPMVDRPLTLRVETERDGGGGRVQPRQLNATAEGSRRAGGTESRGEK